MIGWHTSGAYNFVGGVESVQHANGATVIESKKDNWGAFTLGNFIIGENGIHAGFEDHLFVHEYGHYLQCQNGGYSICRLLVYQAYKVLLSMVAP